MPTGLPSPGDPLAWIGTELASLDERSLRRRLRLAEPRPGGRVCLDGRELLNLCSNDYLGLALDLGRIAAEIPVAPAGATASRLIVGNHPAVAALEAQLAAAKGTEAALLFGSGYLANVGTIPALVGPGDAVFSDRLNHASIVDGILLSRATLYRYRHGDTTHLRALLEEHRGVPRKLLVTDSIFSMDGDLAPLREIAALRQEFGAILMVDEAHSAGLYGPGGAGLVAELGLRPAVDVQMGTLSKAYGCYGAYVAGSQRLIDWLINRARSVVYTTGLPPLLVELLRRALPLVAAANDRRHHLQANAAFWREGLRGLGLDIGASQSQVVPLLVGPADRALALAQDLEEHGVAALAIRPPTVPAGTARLRFSLMATHTRAELETALAVVAAAVARGGLRPGP